MAHAMGVFHHQSRYDRDNYVAVHPENIKPDQDSQSQYNEQTSSDSNNYNTLYDYGSVMHYGDDFFTNGNGPTMVAADPLHQKTMGSREGPSFQDISLVNQHYNCLGNCPDLSCQNNGYPNPANCGQCICPGGFSGTLCDERPAGTNAGCTGDTLTATDTWQMASGSLNQPFQQGVNMDYCYWWITAPVGSTIDIQLAEMTHYASCGMTGMEVKANDMTLTGYRICPPGTGWANLTNIPTITSTTNQVIVRLYNQWGDFNFKLQYALTGSGPPPPPPPPCNNQYSNCNDLASYCTTDPNISTKCPVTCNTCPTGK
uniref:Metalloendopeptidase n=1 Tax=Acrobeloides nanus TaxID=290746 RepID=A0A914CK08_9BILA